MIKQLNRKKNSPKNKMKIHCSRMNKYKRKANKKHNYNQNKIMINKWKKKIKNQKKNLN